MLTAEMRNSPHDSPTLHLAASQRPAAPPSLWKSPWTTVGVWCLAAVSLGASLAYTGADEKPTSTHRDWSTIAAMGLGVDPVAAEEPPTAPVTRAACEVCGRVEAVAQVPAAETRLGAPAAARPKARKPLYEVQVRMDTGLVRVVRVESPPALGSEVTLEQGALRAANG